MVIEEANLRMQIALLQKALGQQQNGVRYVANVHGRGYRLTNALRSGTPFQGSNQIPLKSAPLGLPRRSSRVFGRSEAVATLLAHVTATRFVTILGPGGVGKTTVALQVAETACATYRRTAILASPQIRPTGRGPAANGVRRGAPLTG